jgi:hypothetical protein
MAVGGWINVYPSAKKERKKERNMQSIKLYKMRGRLLSEQERIERGFIWAFVTETKRFLYGSFCGRAYVRFQEKKQ